MYKLIKDSSCGEEILQSYESKYKYLTDKYRKLLVKLVHNLLEYKQKVGRQILSSEKCIYAKAIIDLFPNLKNLEGNLGYVSVSYILFLYILTAKLKQTTK